MSDTLEPQFAPRHGLFEQALWMARLNAGRRLRSEDRIGTKGENMRVLVAEGGASHADNNRHV